MKIKDNKHLFYAIERMLQGLCYWMGYRYECYATHTISEAAAVEIAIGILNSHLDHNVYVVKCESLYTRCGYKSKTQVRADVVIFERKSSSKDLVPCCVMEFKMAHGAKKGIWNDIIKLSKLPHDVSRLAILLSSGNSGEINSFVDISKDKAKRSVNSDVPIHVVRAAKAMETSGSKHPHRAICIELV